eukprot:TRINITY_DN36258_c0_g1_i1.p1 TRINITY_DN36258_c0_g1~~TRINITY_DN36258_c0_g1_i1.p1  ORF type:complete len:943 (+),score=299.96 TRINITY_DN36258_c0_g1_i1:72-2831(+)
MPSTPPLGVSAPPVGAGAPFGGQSPRAHARLFSDGSAAGGSRDSRSGDTDFRRRASVVDRRRLTAADFRTCLPLPGDRVMVRNDESERWQQGVRTADDVSEPQRVLVRKLPSQKLGLVLEPVAADSELDIRPGGGMDVRVEAAQHGVDGLLVVHVVPGTRAQEEGWLGAVIEKVDGQRVDSVADFERVVAMHGHGTAPVRLRGGTSARFGGLRVRGAEHDGAAADPDLCGHIDGLARFEGFRLTALRRLTPIPFALATPGQRALLTLPGDGAEQRDGQRRWVTVVGPAEEGGVEVTVDGQTDDEGTVTVGQEWWAGDDGNARCAEGADRPVGVELGGQPDAESRERRLEGWWADLCEFECVFEPPDPVPRPADPAQLVHYGLFSVQVQDNPRMAWGQMVPDDRCQAALRLVLEQWDVATKTLRREVLLERAVEDGRIRASAQLELALAQKGNLCGRMVAASRKRHERLERALKSCAQLYDTNNDGSLGRDEVDHFLRDYLMVHRSVTEAEGRKVVALLLEGVDLLIAEGRQTRLADGDASAAGGSQGGDLLGTPLRPESEADCTDEQFIAQLEVFAADLRAMLRPFAMETAVRELLRGMHNGRKLIAQWMPQLLVAEKGAEERADWESFKRFFFGAKVKEHASVATAAVGEVAAANQVLRKRVWRERPDGMPIAPPFFLGYHLMPLLPPAPLGLLSRAEQPDDRHEEVSDDEHGGEGTYSGIGGWVYTLAVALLLVTTFAGIGLLSSYAGLPGRDSSNINDWSRQTICQVLTSNKVTLASQGIFDTFLGEAAVRYNATATGEVQARQRNSKAYDNTLAEADIWQGSADLFQATFRPATRHRCWYDPADPLRVRLWDRTPVPWRVCESVGIFCVVVGGLALVFFCFVMARQCRSQEAARKRYTHVSGASKERAKGTATTA